MYLSENIAYSKEYQKLKKLADFKIFSEENFVNQDIVFLSFGYEAIFRHYEKCKGDSLFSSSRFWLKKNGNTVYQCEMPLDRGWLVSRDIISHANGSRYLIFTTELYGYSVLNLETMQATHYIPNGRIEGEESFLWCEAHYCSTNNLLCVQGCYWAYPDSLLLVDFTSPEQTPLYVYEFCQQDAGESLVQIEWMSDGALVYQTEFEEDGEWMARREWITAKQLEQMLRRI